MGVGRNKAGITIEVSWTVKAKLTSHARVEDVSLAAILLVGAITTGLLKLNDLPPGLQRRRVERLLARTQTSPESRAPPSFPDHEPDPDWDAEDQHADEN